MYFGLATILALDGSWTGAVSLKRAIKDLLPPSPGTSAMVRDQIMTLVEVASQIFDFGVEVGCTLGFIIGFTFGDPMSG